jgi:hypothetical protein
LQSAGTTAITVDTSQNVGIGTTSPSNKLHVSTANTAPAQFGYTSGASLAVYCSSSSSSLSGVGDVAQNNLFAINSASSYAIVQTNGSERMRINSSGNVGIGVTTLASWSLGKALEIGFSGNALNATRQAEFNVNCNATYEGSWKYGGSGKAAIIQFSDGTISTLTTTASGSAGGAISWSSGPYVANGGTSWTSSSDERLKNITGEIENALDKVGQLRAAKFTWKADKSNKAQVGLIAQDVQAVLPEVVNSTAYIMDDDTEYLGINYDQVIPLLVASIKELKAELNTVKAELAALRG